ncbi:hypothetical protein R3P38DRAFT_2787497 [Favolaschia claudopus]|uniref:DNA 3'-5' helicase n=1 Tax=Favolaschia claudopus TaxID=2862362 RepID=A0AAW0ARD9_9AGAR
MPPDDEGRHPALRQRSAGVLEDARLWAATEYGYNSVRVRATMNNALKTRANYNAHTWQLDVAEALLLHVDCLVIAGTGSGKTTPFLLPLLLPENKDKFALIILPLLSLQAEQFVPILEQCHVRHNQGQDIPDISQVIRFGAPISLEVLKQYFGRAGRDLSTQKKSTRKKQKTAAATAVDAAQALLATTATAPAPILPDNLPFPVLLPEDQLPAHLDWRNKLDPGHRLYASAQSPSLPTGECCDLCSGNGPFPVHLDQPMHPTTPPSVSSVSTPASTPNQHGKRPLINRPDGADNTGPKFRIGVHLANCKAAIERWSYRVIKRDYEDGPFTADMLVSSTVVTYLAHNRFQSLDELCAALEHSTRSWGLVKRYGREVLQLLACLDVDLEAQRRNAAREKEEERRQREEERAAVRAAEAEQRRIQCEAVFALRRQAAEARRAETERVRVEKAERLLARQKERDRARGEKQQKRIHEFIGKLNAARGFS